MSSILASGPPLDAREFRARAQEAIFSERGVRDEDQRAIAAEREELRQFLADYEDWLDGRRAEMPDPLPVPSR